jgi:hypothetical protein
MALTIDDCMALAARESATEAELRAAVCVAVGQALHYRYEASGYRDAAEVAKRDAHRARREADMTSLECVKARDALWAERDAALARPAYEARTVAPTQGECAAHEAAGGIWYITGGTTLSCVVSSCAADAPSWAAYWIPLDRDGLPCAWPVAGEVTP